MINKYKIPKTLLSSKYRKEMWKNVQDVAGKIEKLLPVKSIYVLGSFTTKKTRPADVDFIFFITLKEKNKNSKWSMDLTIAPDNKYGRFMLADADKWVKEKYGMDKSVMVKLK